MTNARYYILLLVAIVPALVSAQPIKVLESADEPRKELSIEDFKYKEFNNLKQSGTLFSPVRKKPGFALLSSAILPGSGQAASNKWLRAGTYIAAEALLFTVHFTKMRNARKEERQYEEFADNNWSVVTYSQWLVNYYDENNISSSSINELRNQVAGLDPTYDPDVDWNRVDIELLRSVERNTPFISPDGTGNNFSHVLPNYGSQQYYELISKYYQFGPGWRDFGNNQNGAALDNRYKLNWDGTDMPFNFFRGSSLAESFNDNYRVAGNMLSLLVLNHMVSAFDAFLTVKVNNNRIRAQANPLKLQTFSLQYHF